MLLELHVKNLALIEKADVEFRQGLNILTGETGAGKSIIIGSVGMALGGKEMCIRDRTKTGNHMACTARYQTPRTWAPGSFIHF